MIRKFFSLIISLVLIGFFINVVSIFSGHQTVATATVIPSSTNISSVEVMQTEQVVTASASQIQIYASIPGSYDEFLARYPDMVPPPFDYTRNAAVAGMREWSEFWVFIEGGYDIDIVVVPMGYRQDLTGYVATWLVNNLKLEICLPNTTCTIVPVMFYDGDIRGDSSIYDHVAWKTNINPYQFFDSVVLLLNDKPCTMIPNQYWRPVHKRGELDAHC